MATKTADPESQNLPAFISAISLNGGLLVVFTTVFILIRSKVPIIYCEPLVSIYNQHIHQAPNIFREQLLERTWSRNRNARHHFPEVYSHG